MVRVEAKTYALMRDLFCKKRSKTNRSSAEIIVMNGVEQLYY